MLSAFAFASIEASMVASLLIFTTEDALLIRNAADVVWNSVASFTLTVACPQISTPKFSEFTTVSLVSDAVTVP